MRNYILEAHRGVGTEYPENTMSAFRAAADQGYGMIELDTKFTAENICVIHHDLTVNRTARFPDGSIITQETPISSHTLAQLLELDYGIAKDEKFRGEKICTLEEVLDFALETKIPLKFDNVVQKHTCEQKKIFFDTIERKKVSSLVGFTANSLDYIKKVLERFPASQIHFDGPVSDSILEELGRLVPKNQLTVWLRYDNAITSWNRNVPVNRENSESVRKFGKLGVWLLTDLLELKCAVEEFGADVIETDGTLKPLMRRNA